MWNRNEMQGRLDHARGRIKQAVGTLIGNNDLATAGRVEMAMGKAKTVVGETSRRTDEAIAQVGKAAKK
jgi:uncharacterized protein YjbJ (UPF0337 family)